MSTADEAGHFSRGEVVRTAEFDQKLKVYWYWQGLIALVVCFITIPAVPLWLLGFGTYFSRRAFESLECTLSAKTLEFKKGWVVRTEKTIPLDKIQDVTLKEGPLLRKLGLAQLSIETAGQSAQGASDCNLIGIIDAPAFREAVLAQRDRVAAGVPASTGAVASAASSTGDEVAAILGEVRDSLGRIEERLDRRWKN